MRAAFVQFGMNFSQHDLDCWLDRGAVHGGLLLCPTTHAPHGPEVEQILSNLVALFAACRASCDRSPQGAAGPDVPAKNTAQGPQSAGADGLLGQKSICDNQSHHARENQQGREGCSDHWPGRIARSRWSGLRFISLCRWFASLRFRRRAHASHLAVISALDLANGQRRGLGFAHHLESGSIVSQELLRV
jgi:hypothetical protein